MMAVRSRSRSPWRAWINHPASSADERIRIVIVPMHGGRFSLFVLPSETINAIKVKIETRTHDVMREHGDHLGVKSAIQRLRFEGALLDTGRLRDHNIVPGALIKLRWCEEEYEQSAVGTCMAGLASDDMYPSSGCALDFQPLAHIAVHNLLPVTGSSCVFLFVAGNRHLLSILPLLWRSPIIIG